MPIGSIAWANLTIADAPPICDFCQEVVGWEPSPVAMKGYEDFNMNVPGTQTAAAGICHAHGGNAELPPQWLIYVFVKDLATSGSACERLGGKILRRSKSHWLIEDSPGAMLMIYQPE